MMENDDRLLKQFFADNKREIADNGFSRRVMRLLPDRGNRLAQLWSTCCFTLAVVLFVTLDGFQLILNTLRETFDSLLQSGATELNPKSLAIAAVVLLFMGYRKIASLA